MVALQGTPHIWIAGEDGALHWGGDTRALQGRAIDWGKRVDVALDQLKSYRIGDPWLSAGLLKSGDPIYLVKWESNQTEPTLQHIQSIADMELFGINGSNYGQYVLDQQAWEQRFGMNATLLKKDVLAGAVPGGTTTTAPTAVPTSDRGILARAISLAERAAFLESAVSISLAKGAVTKWDEPIRVQLRQTSYPAESQVVDSMVYEAQGLLGGRRIDRVTSGGNLIIDFVPLSQIPEGSEGVLGFSDLKLKPTGAIGQCVIGVAHDLEKILGSLASRLSPQMKTDLFGLVIRHEFGHCLGLGHNSSEQSFMSYNYSPWDRFYTAGARNAQFPDFDRALLRTLYHPSVRIGMKGGDLNDLFAG